MSVPRWISKIYNRVSPKEWRPNPQHAAGMASSSSFFYDELRRALLEQAFGLRRYEIAGQYSAHEAAATVTLLEGNTARVSLNTRGYQLDGGQTFESIEELLQSISPMYVQKREDVILTKLQGLQ